jgi:hypothetical protein
VRTLPTVFAIDGEGRIAWMSIGSGLGFHRLLETLTARMLARLEERD